MSKKLAAQWIARFERIAMTATDDGWHYSRMALNDVLTHFNSLGLRYHSIDAKDAVYREQVVKTMKTRTAPGCYFRILRKD